MQEVSVLKSKNSEFWNFCSSGTSTTLIGTDTKGDKKWQYQSGTGTTLIGTSTEAGKLM